MKKSLFFVIALSLLVFMSSCTQAKYEIVAEKINSQCPMSMGLFGELTGVEFDDGNIVYKYSVNETYTNIETLSQNPELMKKSIEAMVKNPSKDFEDFLTLIREDKIGMTIKFLGKDSGKEAMLTLDYKELLTFMDYEASPDELLRAQIEQTNASCPMTIDASMVMTHLDIEGNYVVYYYSVDERQVSLSLLNENKEIMRESIIQTLKAQINDPMFKSFLYACSEAGKGIAYKYVGKASGDEVVVRIELSEIGYIQ